jgi:hypothetical protein
MTDRDGPRSNPYHPNPEKCCEASVFDEAFHEDWCEKASPRAKAREARRRSHTGESAEGRRRGLSGPHAFVDLGTRTGTDRIALGEGFPLEVVYGCVCGAEFTIPCDDPGEPGTLRHTPLAGDTSDVKHAS